VSAAFIPKTSHLKLVEEEAEELTNLGSRGETVVKIEMMIQVALHECSTWPTPRRSYWKWPPGHPPSLIWT